MEPSPKQLLKTRETQSAANLEAWFPRSGNNDQRIIQRESEKSGPITPLSPILGSRTPSSPNLIFHKASPSSFSPNQQSFSSVPLSSPSSSRISVQKKSDLLPQERRSQFLSAPSSPSSLSSSLSPSREENGGEKFKKAKPTATTTSNTPNNWVPSKEGNKRSPSLEGNSDHNENDGMICPPNRFELKNVPEWRSSKPNLSLSEGFFLDKDHTPPNEKRGREGEGEGNGDGEGEGGGRRSKILGNIGGSSGWKIKREIERNKGGERQKEIRWSEGEREREKGGERERGRREKERGKIGGEGYLSIYHFILHQLRGAEGEGEELREREHEAGEGEGKGEGEGVMVGDLQSQILGNIGGTSVRTIKRESELEGEFENTLFAGCGSKHENPRKIYTPVDRRPTFFDERDSRASSPLKFPPKSSPKTGPMSPRSLFRSSESPRLSRKKREKEKERDKEKRGERGGGEEKEEKLCLGGKLDGVAKKFWEKVVLHFDWHEPGFSVYCLEYASAFTVHILPVIAQTQKKKKYFPSVTRYLHDVTLFLHSELKKKKGQIIPLPTLPPTCHSSSPVSPSLPPPLPFEVTPKWVSIAQLVWESSHWAKILHKTAQYTTSTLLENEIQNFKDLIDHYLVHLRAKQPEGKQILEKICFFLLEYLSSHSLDPCNLFVGCNPSKLAFQHLFVPVIEREREEKQERRNKKSVTLLGLLQQGWEKQREDEEERERLKKKEGNEETEQEVIEKEEQARNSRDHKEKERKEDTEEREQQIDNFGTEREEDVEREEEREEDEERKEDTENEREQQIDELVIRESEGDDERREEEKNFPLDSNDFLQLLHRWRAIKHTPEQIVEEVDSLLSLISPAVICPAGWYVAVDAEAISSQVYRQWFWSQEFDPEHSFKWIMLRLSKSLLPSDAYAHVFLDCFEKREVKIPTNNLYYYNKNHSSLVSLEEERNTNSGLFGTPLFMFFTKMKNFVKENVLDFITENGAKRNPGLLTKLNYNDLEELCRDRMILETLVSSPSMINKSLIPSLIDPMLKSCEHWAAKIPPMLFPPPRLEEAVKEISRFTTDNIPALIQAELEEHLTDILRLIRDSQNRMAKILKGETKMNLCRWWLSHIENRVDNFLITRGYVHNSLPQNYLNKPPEDMDVVLKNKTLLEEIILEEGKGGHGVEDFMVEVCDEVYDVVDSLRDEMLFVMEKKWVGLPVLVESGENDLDNLQRDYDYLVRMKKMDEEIARNMAKQKEQRDKAHLAVSDVVPVAGLVMARFHIHSCELETAIWHWEKKAEMKEKERLRELKKVFSSKIIKAETKKDLAGWIPVHGLYREQERRERESELENDKKLYREKLRRQRESELENQDDQGLKE